MIEKILKDTYVSPKVELSQAEYNRLVQTAQMKAKKIEERAREIYEKEGVVRIDFTGRFYRKRYGEVESEKYEFSCDCAEYLVTPTEGEPAKKMFTIPQNSRVKIAQHVENFVEECFECYFGRHMKELNEIERLKHKAQRQGQRLVVWTLTGWLMAVLMLVAAMSK